VSRQSDKKNLEKVEINISTRVLVMGSGPVAHLTALELAEIGHEVLLCNRSDSLVGNIHLWHTPDGSSFQPGALIKALKDDPRIEIRAPAEILEFQGSPGNFQVKLAGSDGDTLTQEVGALILSSEPLPMANFASWGVNESEKIKALSWVESTLSSSADDPFSSGDSAKKFVFLCGFTHHSNPFSQQRAMESAAKLVSKGKITVIFLVDHLQVADYGLERLTHRAREAGILFVKMTGDGPEIETGTDKVMVSYFDQELGEKVTVSPDFLVLEEAYKAPKEMTHLADILGITADRSGFFQGNNIYNRPIYTNRNGIWVVDSAKGPASIKEGIEEAKAAALDIHHFLGERGQAVAEKRLLFDEGKCGKCLTCYRSCPHHAISNLEVKPLFHDLACEACGICAAACPMDAIQIARFTDNEILSEVEKAATHSSAHKKEGSVCLIAFCCENSAFHSARLASLVGLPLPNGLELVKVPCAGRVDVHYLLKALESGADGVMVIGCHDESCKSVKGNRLAKKRIEIINKSLEEVGLEKARLFFESCAPGMGWEFSKIAQEAERVVRDL
jgi:coenzyme F420-reducing hydrogenase delta subunit/ferredoxin